MRSDGLGALANQVAWSDVEEGMRTQRTQNHTPKRLLAASSLSLAFIPGACAALALPGGDGRGAAFDELERSREMWQAAEIDDYTYVFERVCFCAPEWMGPYLVTVVDGEVVSAEPIEDMDIEAELDDIPTVDELFENAEAELEHADKATIEYDTEFGYPTSFVVDRIDSAVDDEYSLHITELTPTHP